MFPDCSLNKLFCILTRFFTISYKLSSSSVSLSIFLIYWLVVVLLILWVSSLELSLLIIGGGFPTFFLPIFQFVHAIFLNFYQVNHLYIYILYEKQLLIFLKYCYNTLFVLSFYHYNKKGKKTNNN